MATQTLPVNHTSTARSIGPTEALRAHTMGLGELPYHVHHLVWAVWALAGAHFLSRSAFGVAMVAVLSANFVFALQRALLPTYLGLGLRWAALANAAVGVAGVGILALVGRGMAVQFNEPALVVLLPITGIATFLDALALIPGTLTEHSPNRGVMWLGHACAGLAGLAVLMNLAIGGSGAWSLVYAGLVGSALRLALIWWAAPRGDELPPLALEPVSSAAGFVARNMDKVVVGAALGTAALGLFQMVADLVTYPLSVLSQALAQRAVTLMPDGLTAQSRRLLRCVAAVAVPLSLVAAFSAKPLVAILFGSQWAQAVNILRFGAVAMALLPLAGIAAVLLDFHGRRDIRLMWSAIGTVAGVAGAAVALPFGLDAVAGAWLLLTAGLTVPMTLAAFRLSGVADADWLNVLKPVLGAGVVCAVVLALPLPAGGFIALLAYGLVLWRLWPNALADSMVLFSSPAPVEYLAVPLPAKPEAVRKGPQSAPAARPVRKTIAR